MFEHLKQPQYKEQVVTCSYLEIYNEELRDLLADSNGAVKMDIMEGKDGTFCRYDDSSSCMLIEISPCFSHIATRSSNLRRGLTEKQVHSAADVLNLMQRAQHSRMIGETRMNKSSSRSHCLFTIQVHGKISLLDGDGDMEFTGKLHMVDLAGSEVRRSL
jgi:kinesin family protein 11